MKKKELTPEQIVEVNIRVAEIIDTFRQGLKNSSAFDFRNYWHLAMEGNPRMSDACKYAHDVKHRVMAMLDKEEMLVCREPSSKYQELRRTAKDKIITSMMKMLRPALRGREQEHVYMERVVNLSDFVLNKGEELTNIKLKGQE